MTPKQRFRCIPHPFAISSVELSRWRAWVGEVVCSLVDAHIVYVEREWGSPFQLLVYLCSLGHLLKAPCFRAAMEDMCGIILLYFVR